MGSITLKSRHDRRPFLVAAICLAIIAGSVLLGGGSSNPLDLFTDGNGAILALRLWRVGLGVVVGASLALAGTAFQALLRNPLADPYVLGISAGSGIAAAGAIAAGALVAVGSWILPVAGFVGAMLSLIVVYSLARVHGRASPHTLVLAGVAWGALCGSVLAYVVSRSSAEGIHALIWWFLGDLQVYNRPLAAIAAASCAVGAVLLMMRARALDALLLGDEAAAHLGIRPERERQILLLLAAWLVALSVTTSGLIGFVGLVAPHTARAIVGSGHRRLLPAAALIGAAFLCLGDGLGRAALYPGELPVGVFTSVVGAPFFLLLLRGRRREIWTGT